MGPPLLAHSMHMLMTTESEIHSYIMESSEELDPLKVLMIFYFFFIFIIHYLCF